MTDDWMSAYAGGELEFRDGKRLVPVHLYRIMRSMETYRLTYEEAVRACNDRMLGDVVNGHHRRIIDEHFGRG